MIVDSSVVSGHAKRFDLREEWDLVSRGKKTISAWLAEVKGPICDRGMFPAIPSYSFTTHSENEIDEHRHVE